MKNTTIKISIFLLLLSLSFSVSAQNKKVESENSAAQEKVLDQEKVKTAGEQAKTQNEELAPETDQNINELKEGLVPIKTAHNSEQNRKLSLALEQDTSIYKKSHQSNDKHMYISNEDALKIIESLGIKNAKEALKETEQKNKEYKSINQNIEKDKK